MSLQTVLIIIGIIVVLCVYLASYRIQRYSRKNSNLSVKKMFDSFENVNGSDGGIREENGQIPLPIENVDESQMNLFDSVGEKLTEEESALDQRFQIDEIGDNETQDDRNEPDLISLLVKPKGDESWCGRELLRALNAVGLEFGRASIFHKNIIEDNNVHTIFSVANMMEPGAFDLQKMEIERYEGVAFFIKFPSALDNGVAFEMFFDTVKSFSSTISGEIYSDVNEIMCESMIDSLRKKVNVLSNDENF